MRAAIKRSIDQLRPIYRSVLWLRDMEDLSISEVAAILKLNANTVKIRLRRARQTLKSLLDQEGSAKIMKEFRAILRIKGKGKLHEMQPAANATQSDATLARHQNWTPRRLLSGIAVILAWQC